MIARGLTKLHLARGFGMWKDVPTTPPDPILGINEKFKESTDPKKVNLTVGAYRDENGAPWILPSVKMAMKAVYESPADHEYIPIIGDKDFVGLSY
jgi:aspartate/tyrosine/aromatic aminotransferase